ncbi:MAG: DUF6776 family protein [Betaproteobacteria bacterium]
MALLRALKQRFGISAPRVAVRAHVPWYWRWLGILSMAVLAAGIGWFTLHPAVVLSGFAAVDNGISSEKSSEESARQQQELAELRARAAVAERQFAIERATYDDLVRQIRALTEQNAALKEDLAFFQTLMPAGGGTMGIMVDRFRLQKDILPGEYRYRLFLVQTGPRDRNFQGRLQFVVNLTENERTTALTVPAESERDAREYRLDFKFFQRVEGTFRVNPNAVVKSLQVRVYEKGSDTPRLAHTVQASS